MKTITEQDAVSIYCDTKTGFAYIQQHQVGGMEGTAEKASAEAVVAQVKRDRVLGNKTQLDPQEVFELVSPHFRVVFDRKTFLQPLVQAVAMNAAGFTERDPEKMVELIGQFVDYPPEKISHRVAMRLMSDLDPQNRYISGTYRAGVPRLHEARTPIGLPRTDESFAEEAVRFRFCAQHLEDVEKRAHDWRITVFTKFIDLREVHFDYGNEHAVTIEEVVDELKEIRKVYGHRTDFDDALKSVVADCLTSEDHDRVVALLEPLKIPGLKSNRPDAGSAVDQSIRVADVPGRDIAR